MELAIIGALALLGAYGLFRMRGEQSELEPPAPEPEPVKLERVAVIGDSLAVGLRPQLLARAELDDVQVDYSAKGGTLTGYWLDKLPDLEGVDVLVVALGTNDAAGAGTSFERSMDKILQYASLARVPVVWVEPTGEHLKSYDSVVAVLEHALAIKGISVLVDKPTSGYAKDNVHLSPDAYRQWADEIWEATKEVKQP